MILFSCWKLKLISPSFIWSSVFTWHLSDWVDTARALEEEPGLWLAKHSANVFCVSLTDISAWMFECFFPCDKPFGCFTFQSDRLEVSVHGQNKLQSKSYFILTVWLHSCKHKNGLTAATFLHRNSTWPAFTKTNLPEHRAPAIRRSLCLKIFIALPDGSGALLVKLVQVGTHPVTLVTAAECTVALLSVIRPTDLWARSHPSHLHTHTQTKHSHLVMQHGHL